MRTTMVMALICFFFLAFTATKPYVTAATEVVRDFRGDPLRPTDSYYIVSAIRGGGGGGVTLARIHNNTCATDIVQEGSDLFRGLPAKIIPKIRTVVVPESADVIIKFSVIPLCRHPVTPEWKVDEEDPSTGQQFLSLANEHEEASFFRIENSGFGYSYKLVHCPLGDSCQDVDRYWGDASRRLALSETPFYVNFVKADYSQLLMKA